MIYNTRIFKSLFILFIILFSFAAKAQTDNAENKAWVEKSNNYAKILIDIDEKYSPEFGSAQGLAFYDTLISVPTLANIAARRKETEDAVLLLKAAKPKETNIAIKQDLDILINQAELDFRNEDFDLSRKVSFLNATSDVFRGLQILLDDQTAAGRRNAAVTRLGKYAGLQNGYSPITAIYKDRTSKQMNKRGMIYPSKQAMEVELSRNPSMLNGIAGLFKKYGITSC